jgi:hypothetical protein
MGKCETARTSIGIKILLSDLISQINETNFDLINKILNEGFISDENENYNDAYTDIIWSNDLPKNYLDFKIFLEQEFKNRGLFDKELLLSIKKILSTDRWGYDREGKNSNYRPIDFDLSVDVEEYKEIKKYTIVFILEQHSG